MQDTQLIELTDCLIECTNFAAESYERVRKTGISGDFFQEVKPFADKVKNICDEWLPLAIRWVEANRPKHIHNMQLHNLVENIQMVSVRALYPETSLKRFKSHIQSVSYVLATFKQVITETQ